jgi:uncharacterized membrane protein HdeD (DUF308 family)
MLKSSANHLILLGVLAIIAGIVALAWPGITILVLVIMFAVYAFSDAGLQGVRAFSGGGAGRALGHLLVGLIDVIAGVLAIAWPGPSALVLVLVIGVWAVVGGFTEFAFAFAAGETAGTRTLFLLGGLVSVAFGVVLCARPGVGAVTLVLLYGLFALCYGISQVAAGVHLRSARRDVRTALDRVA